MIKKVTVISLILIIISFIPANAVRRCQPAYFRRERGARINNGVSSQTIRMSNGHYRMYYTGADIMAAGSSDGKVFKNNRTVLTLNQVKAEFPTLKQISNSAIVKLSNGRWRMLFEGKTQGNPDTRRLYSAQSADGIDNWHIEPGVRLADHEDITFTSVPEIIRLSDGRLRIYYATGLRTKSSVSSDEGLTWTKEGFIIINKHFNTLVDADITKIGKGTYVLLFADMPDVPEKKDDPYQTRSRFQRIYRAYSTDGRNFTYNRIVVFARTANVMDPDMVRIGPGRYRVYYSRMIPGENSSDIISSLYR